MLKLAGLALLVLLILVGALMPLKYMARMHLPKLGPGHEESGARRTGADHHDD